ncbi:histone lysine methyltransferase Set9 [Schizosaccharomyces japonicus yFS275]|uniref:Histone lysine methyltransferase Set9 n=1 Tax=Schizosaccharomyces japonicus (strain yFS275 / FY16936) TaxID=402676 RepID=B6JZV6_SCHJY|nr:histone lysine methyltransferase Set9 [Schizosaccharomyces japonicus yFS275]EEB06106.2 histone lysine methyltransferase Set9 [Schizosaccharomyces japonicus yFS275]
MRIPETRLEAFSLFDDMCTDNLIDGVYYWTRIHKMRRRLGRPRRQQWLGDVIELIQNHIINKFDLDAAVEAFFSIPRIKKVYDYLDDSLAQEFVRHAKLYLLLYAVNCEFEIASTDRFIGSKKSEASAISIKDLDAGYELHDLCGTIIKLTPAEEKRLGDDKDFSVLHSSRLRSMCLFLGPARFVNHDCDANCMFRISGRKVWLQTVRPVRAGEELTTYYSSRYFGPNNRDCLCESCERKGIGGYVKLFLGDSIVINNLDFLVSQTTYSNPVAENTGNEALVKEEELSTTPVSLSASSSTYAESNVALESTKCEEEDVQNMYFPCLPNVQPLFNDTENASNCTANQPLEWDSGGELSEAKGSDLDEELELFIPLHKKRIWAHERQNYLSTLLKTTTHSILAYIMRDRVAQLRQRQDMCEYICRTCQHSYFSKPLRPKAKRECPKCYRNRCLYGYDWPIRYIEIDSSVETDESTGSEFECSAQTLPRKRRKRFKRKAKNNVSYAELS